MNLNLQSFGDFIDVGDGDILFSSFDATNVSPVQIAGKRKAFLWVTALSS